MTEVLDLPGGSSEPYKTLWCAVEVNNISLPIMTEKYLVNDVVFYLVSNWLDFYAQGIDEELYAYIDNELEDYVKAMVEPEDYHLINDIIEQVMDRAKQMVKAHQFEYLKDSNFEIDKIEYRYDANEKHVRWYITLG